MKLLRQAGGGSAEQFSAVTDLAGLALGSVAHLGQPAEYRAEAGSVDSNRVQVTPLLP